MYSVKEVFYSLQGEGRQSGRPAVFCRFTGCNLWNGLVRDKAKSSCPFCDTNFVGVDGIGGGKFPTADILSKHLNSFWKFNNNDAIPYIVFTGGEPLLQLDKQLIDEMHQLGFEVAVETNGSIDPPSGIDWICVSPKVNMDLIVKHGNELKLLYPQEQLFPSTFKSLGFDYFYLQAIDDKNHTQNIKATLDYCLEHPQWHYSLQLHKVLNIN
jgi:7-carboxy-7-deazaguanine synthase